jgi:hypothetical protein
MANPYSLFGYAPSSNGASSSYSVFSSEPCPMLDLPTKEGMSASEMEMQCLFFNGAARPSLYYRDMISVQRGLGILCKCQLPAITAVCLSFFFFFFFHGADLQRNLLFKCEIGTSMASKFGKSIHSNISFPRECFLLGSIS